MKYRYLETLTEDSKPQLNN